MSEIKIAAGTVDITPAKPVALGGYGKRSAPFQAVADALEGNAILVFGQNTRVVFIAIDALYPGRLLRERLLGMLDLAEHELFFSASHTHFAPMTSPDMPRLGIPDIAYVEFVAERLASLVRQLEGRAAPVRCFFHQGMAGHSMNRRLMRWRLTKSGIGYTCGLAPNPDGEKDERIAGLQFCDDQGPVAILWNYACHPTDFPHSLQVSADFPGVVRGRLRDVFGDIPVLFLQGFSGDTRPPFRGVRGARGLLRRILQGPQFRTPGMAEWRAWANGLAATVRASFETKGVPVRLAEPLSTRDPVPESKMGIGGRGDKPLIWHRVDCGGFRIVGVNAEPVTAYRKLIEPLFLDKPLFTAGCLDQTHGYLPTDAMLVEGGYEVNGFRDLFGYETVFRPGLQDAAIAPLKTRLN